MFIMLLATSGLAAEYQVPGDYGTITEALAAADDGDEIIVAPGTYTKPNETFPLRLQKAITLTGASRERTHLKGDGQHTVVSIESADVSLQNFRISDGLGSEGINKMDGGGICIFVEPSATGDIDINDCDIEDNSCPSDETYDGGGGGVYCGGTYCTCFNINISNCNIRRNTVHGKGGGISCALLSNVNVRDTLIEDNLAEDKGGGVYVDVFAALDMRATSLRQNSSPGDPLKPGWGGKGGGLACEDFGAFRLMGCTLLENSARYFGGGVFTRGGLLAAEDRCDGTEWFTQVSDSRIERNRAEVFGGGVYVASSAILDCLNTVLYWNDAAQDGGGVFVAGGVMIGGEVSLAEGCRLEGNESGSRGGGVYLGQNALGTFRSARFLGNASLFDGGAMFLEDEASGVVTDCLMTYNNSARGYAGGIRATAHAYLDLAHCSIVGNFAPFGRSGICLDPNSIAEIRDSILWRNTGGSVEANGATVNITCSLNEDGADPDKDVICCDPGYVGWGNLENIYVNASASLPGDGTLQSPYRSLQTALDAFDLRLADDSRCVAGACDGSTIGADTGVGGSAGNGLADLHMDEGLYDIRGRSIIFIRDVNGIGATDTRIENAVLGNTENSTIRNLSIMGEQIFGGIAIRADVRIQDCNVFANTALADGGGVFIAGGNCVVADSSLSENVCHHGNGGGLYLSEGAKLELALSSVQRNVSADDGGGGLYISGELDARDCNLADNSAAIHGGGLHVSEAGRVNIRHCNVSLNNATSLGGGVMSYGGIAIHRSEFESNVAWRGGAVYISGEPAGPGYLYESRFSGNTARQYGGALYLDPQISPRFVNCEFRDNRGRRGGVGYFWYSRQATFDHCSFIGNLATGPQGGCFALANTGTQFINGCMFQDNSVPNGRGGVVFFLRSDHSTFSNCDVTGSFAGADGGTFYLSASSGPNFEDVNIVGSVATNKGGGLAIADTATPSLTRVRISDCNAVYGGGVYVGNHSASQFVQCGLQNNRAYNTTFSADGGGAYFTEDALGEFTQCLFAGNTAQDDGGGLAVVDRASVVLRNTLLAGNTAVNDGGGIHFTFRGAGTLANCTIARNISAYGHTGAGLYLENENTVKVDSSIIWDNNPDGIPPDANPNVSYCCTQRIWPGIGNVMADPYFVDPYSGSYDLRPDSPCIDAGNTDRSLSDACLPPGQRGPRNDMGITGGPYNCDWRSPSEPNLVGRWTFDRNQISGTTVIDSSGRSRHGVLMNGPTLVPGHSGEALDFDSVDDYVALPIGGLLSTLTDSTFAFWVNFKNSGGSWQRIFDFGTGTSNFMCLVPRMSLTGAMVFIIRSAKDGTEMRIETPWTLPTEWHHVAVVFCGSTVQLYLDGAAVARARGTLTPSNLGWTTNNWLGRSQFSHDAYLSAELDDFRIYSRALSSSELD